MSSSSTTVRSLALLRRNNATLDLTQLGAAPEVGNALEDTLLNRSTFTVGKSYDESSSLLGVSSTIGSDNGGRTVDEEDGETHIGKVNEGAGEYVDKVTAFGGTSEDVGSRILGDLDNAGPYFGADSIVDLQGFTGDNFWTQVEEDYGHDLDADFTIVTEDDTFPPLDVMDTIEFQPSIGDGFGGFLDFDSSLEFNNLSDATQESADSLNTLWHSNQQAGLSEGTYNPDMLDASELALHQDLGHYAAPNTQAVDLSQTIHPNAFGPGGFIPEMEQAASEPNTIGATATSNAVTIWSEADDRGFSSCDHPTGDHVVVWVVVTDAAGFAVVVPHCYSLYPAWYALQVQQQSEREFLFDPEVRFRALHELGGVPGDAAEAAAFLVWRTCYRDDQERVSGRVLLKGLVDESIRRTNDFLNAV